MSFLRAARAALAGQSGLPWILLAVVVILAGLSLSCGNSSHNTPTGPNHNAYVTLPASGSVLLLQINGATGAITTGAQTPQEEDYSPTGLALLPSKKFLYAVNSRANTISIFNVASDGTLTLSGTPTPAGGSSPNAAVIDPSGKYLLVTNNLSDNVSVFSIDPGTGALSPVGLPVPANSDPSEILITPSGQFVYVTNPSLGRVTAFSFCPPQLASEPQCSGATSILAPVPGSPVFSGAGAFGLAVDATERFLYVANPSAANPAPYASTIGNISGFNIDSDTGALSPILGSPFTSTVGSGPTLVTVDPSGRFVYAVTPGSSDSIWCFTITSTNGQLVAVTKSPFSVAAGGLFALFDPSGNYFYIGSPSGNGIEGYTYNPSTGALTVITGSPFSTGTAPWKMVFSE
ncbi:MAG: beta-propeller fold lactonase family protein [Terriglobales bacterium]|jgi:6-phosphogluconolactonase (cycloisomerase 2 family)